MANKFADARRSLLRAKEAAQARLQAIEDERSEIKESLKSLEAALKALGRSNRTRQSRDETSVQEPDGAGERRESR